MFIHSTSYEILDLVRDVTMLIWANHLTFSNTRI